MIWKCLEKHYEVFGNSLCSTHFHIGVRPAFTLKDLKRIAQAMIHFETAFECLVPLCRRKNPYARSNWLETPGFAEKGRSRSDCIAAIGATSSIKQLLGLLHPPTEWFDCGKMCWNFLSLAENGSIEFRKPPVSLTSLHTLTWAELALSFVQASMACEFSHALQNIPPTAGGLRWFLAKFGNVPGINEPSRLRPIFQRTHPESFIEPLIVLQNGCDLGPNLGPEHMRRLHQIIGKLVNEDRERIRSLIQKGRGTYW
jgi:Putative amidoligase enzyme